MSVRRKKFIMPLLYRDATDQNRLKPLTSGEAVIFPGGATINDTVTLAGSGLAVDVHNPGELSAEISLRSSIPTRRASVQPP